MEHRSIGDEERPAAAAAPEEQPEILDGLRLEMGEVRADEEEIPVVQANRRANSLRLVQPAPTRAFERDAPVAIVGYGPSLKNTWEGLRGAKTIITTSKAHKFLLERGIVPTYHVDVDYRPHKVGFLGPLHERTQYVIASHVHPDYVDRLVRERAKVWMFHSQIPNGGPYEPGYPKVEAMFDAGLQAAKLAHDWGFRVQDWYGFDASMEGFGEEQSHAGAHEGFLRTAQKHHVALGQYVFCSNALLVRQALFAERWLRAHSKMKVRIHGDGMLRLFLQMRRRVTVE